MKTIQSEVILEKMNYLEKNRDVIINSLLEVGDCSSYEKIKKYCGIKISILNNLIDLGKRYKEILVKIDNNHDELLKSNYLVQKDFLEKEIYNTINYKSDDEWRDILLVISLIEESEDANIFIFNLYRMYSKFAKSKNLTTRLISTHHSQKGFIKEITLEIKGFDARKFFKYEAGLHMAIKKSKKNKNPIKFGAYVQLFSYVDEKDITIQPSELKIEVFHSSGHGGQSVNTSDSAVRITHLPTGVSAESQNERSQYKNKETALKILRAKLLRLEEERIVNEKKVKRDSLLFEYLRKDEIREYNYIKNLIFDYRLGLNFKNMSYILKGNMQDIIDSLVKNDELTKLENMFLI
jgi:peptide chain release factor 1